MVKFVMKNRVKFDMKNRVKIDMKNRVKVVWQCVYREQNEDGNSMTIDHSTSALLVDRGAGPDTTDLAASK